ncbi:hypothetical protein F5Y09DRAFT_343872 [Xylaria sp. FL1042]|nr:hypothetical protein F5Y09DRAFT_343872 [Xylaria sp. FL1042]
MSNQKDHARCLIVFGNGEKWQPEWRQCGSLVQDRIEYLASSSLTGPTHRLLGPMVYKLFSAFVDYDEPYRGMQEIYSDNKMQETSAKVRFAAKESDLFVYHPCWIDSPAHISGFVLNGTELTPADTVYISHCWKSMRIATTKLSPIKTDAKVPAGMIGDVYVLSDGNVIALIQDIKFRRIKRSQLEHFLPLKKHESLPIRSTIEPVVQEKEMKGDHVQPSAFAVVFDIIAQEVGVEPEELADHALLADTGVDSLFSLIAASMKDVLGVEVPSSLFMSSVTFGDLRNSLTEYYSLGTPSAEDVTTTRSKSSDTTTEKTVLFLFPDGVGPASSYMWLAAVGFGGTDLDAIYRLDSQFAGDDAAVFGDISLNDVVGSRLVNRGLSRIRSRVAAARRVQSIPHRPSLSQGAGGASGMGQVVHGFETAQDIIDIATFVHGGNHNSRSSIQKKEDEDTMQAHFISSMVMLEKYRPLPLPQLGLRATLLWAKNGQDGAKAVDSGSFTSANTAGSWVLKPRQDYEPHGWDMLLPETSIQCLVVEGDHFSIRKTPVVAEVGKMLRIGFALPPGGQS